MRFLAWSLECPVRFGGGMMICSEVVVSWFNDLVQTSILIVQSAFNLRYQIFPLSALLQFEILAVFSLCFWFLFDKRNK